MVVLLPYKHTILAAFIAFFIQTAHAEDPLNLAPAVLIQISKCESSFRQYDSKGRVLKSDTNDYGLFQINASHIKEARALGYDIMTPEGNTAYALYLYQKNGTRDWNASKGCWQPSSDG